MQPISLDQSKAGLWSDRSLRRISIGLAALGLVVALYLLYFKFNPASAMCTGVGDCGAVNASVYSAIRGVPVSLIGALGYLLIGGVLLLETRSALVGQWGPLAVFGAALVGTLYSAYLTYIEVAVIYKICPYCVTSAVVMTLIFLISIARLRRYM